MPDRLKRASFVRIAVVMAVLAFPLLAVGTAQAALAGATPESTSNRPDLISATVVTSNAVDFCFDKTLNNTALSGSNFLLGGYRSETTIPAPAGAAGAALEQTFDTSGKCVRASFTPGNTGFPTIGDINQYTYGQVLAGGVQTTAAISNTETDSTGLTFPSSMTPTHNGTAGFTIGPDLTSVLVDPTTNTITYVFDQNIDTAVAPVANDFTFTRSGGTLCPVTPPGTGNTLVATSANTVTIHFDPVACPVSDAQRAGTLAGAIPAGSAADPGEPSTPDEVIVPASTTSTGTGTTAAPDLTGTQLTNSGSDLNFTFDKTVTVGTPLDFHAVLSDTIVVTANSCSAINTTNTSTTVQCQFTGMSQFSEYVVRGAVDAGAVTETSAPHIASVPDALPAGDNTGAFARGFTTGPDVFGGIINTTTGVLTLALDQRIFSDIPGNIHLIDGTGVDTTPAGASSVAFPSQAAGPEAVTVQFSPGQASTAKNVAVRAGALTTAPTVGAVNASQVLSITSTSSILKHLKTAKHMSKRATARSNARSWAKNQARVRKLEREVRAHRVHL